METFTEEYIQTEGDVLFIFNKEEIMKLIGIRPDIDVKIINEALNQRRVKRNDDTPFHILE